MNIELEEWINQNIEQVHCKLDNLTKWESKAYFEGYLQALMQLNKFMDTFKKP